MQPCETGMVMDVMLKRKLIHEFFVISIIIKGIDGVLEIIGGGLLFFFSRGTIKRIVRVITQHELSEDPHDIFAGFLVKSAHSLLIGAKTFVAVYLFSHGIIKVALIMALFRRKLWAYPAANVFFFLFILYQEYRYFLTYSIWLQALSLLDFIVIILTWMEYSRLKEGRLPVRAGNSD